MTFSKPPTHSGELKVSFPAEHVLLLALNRPKMLNAMSPQLEADLNLVLAWFDDEPELWAAVITGEGRLFCAGADLLAWNDDNRSGARHKQSAIADSPHGFGAISRRNNSTAPRACKPLVAAINGGAHGGGLELALGCDLIVAADDAKFSFPEVKRGVVAAQGGIPRIVQTAGHQLASELVLLGRTVSAAEARDRFRFVNFVVSRQDVVTAAIRVAVELTHNSPDAVQSSRKAIWDVADSLGVEDAFQKHVWRPENARVYSGTNLQEGVTAFVEKRKPRWTSPAKL